MSTFRDHRTHSRMPCLAHLEVDCKGCRTRGRIKGMMYNMSDEGLYLEAQGRVSPGSKVIIQDVRAQDEGDTYAALKGNAGVVRWARPIERQKRGLFGYGIWLYYPDLAEGFEALRDIRFYCDMCGQPVKIGNLKGQKGPLWMCPRCNDFVESLPDVLGEELDRYLMGNVL